MNDIVYRITDAVQGALIVVLLYMVCRLLVYRREGVLRVRYMAACLLLVSCLQSAVSFLWDDESMSTTLFETISLWVDVLAALVGIAAIAVLIRNRRFYSRATVWTACSLIVAKWCCFLLCAVWGFADWTYMVYLPLSALLWGALGWLIDHATPMTSEKVVPIEDTVRADPFLEQLNAVLQQGRLFCREDLTRDEVCRHMLTNRTTFSQRLTAAADMTFSEYLREMRLKEAARLLRETDMPIDQVAFEVGLRSASGFHRNFLLSYGMTPKAYRERNKS